MYRVALQAARKGRAASPALSSALWTRAAFGPQEPSLSAAAAAGGFVGARGGLPAAQSGRTHPSFAARFASTSKVAESNELLIDTLEVMRGFEQAGLKREEADVLTRHVTKLILQTTGQFSDKFASNTYLEKMSGKMRVDMKTFKNEILKTQELQLTNLQKEVEATKQELAKLKTEIRYEMDKMISSQRLDLNLEKGRLRDELQATTHSVQTIETQLNKDINGIRTGIEANKNEIIKYSIGTLVAVSSVGLGLLRLMT